jgi:serine phosphatase RsbU (regulator of sigma subunit)
MSLLIKIKYYFTVLPMLFLCTVLDGNTPGGNQPMNAPDSAHVLDLNDMAWDYLFYLPDSTLIITRYTLKFAKNHRYLPALADGSNIAGLAHYIMDRYDSAYLYFEDALTYREKLNDEEGKAAILSNLALVSNAVSDYKNAIVYNHEALKIREEKEDLESMAISLNNLGMTYRYMEKYGQALKYYQQALKIREQLKDTSGIISVLNNLGEINLKMPDDGDSCLKKAGQYFYRCRHLIELTGENFSLANLYVNLGNLEVAKQDREKAIKLQNKALKLYQQMNDNASVGLALFNIAKIKLDQEKYGEALLHAEKSKNLARSAGNLEQLKEAYHLLSEIHAGRNDFKDAYFYNNMFITLEDSLLQVKNSRELAYLNVKYEVARKENSLLKKEISIDQLKAAKSQMIIIIIGLLLTILAIILTCIARMYGKKKKNNRVLQQKNLQITKQQKTITDSIHYSQTIQGAVLPKPDTLLNAFTDAFMFYKPKDIVGGDFLWHKKNGDSVFFAAIDCTGHGVPGAMLTLIANFLLSRIIVEKKYKDPACILEKLNDGINAILKSKLDDENYADGMDIILFKLTGGVLEYAGTNMTFIYSSPGKFELLKGSRRMIGGIQRKNSQPFFKYVREIQAGDILYLFSDGYYDQFGGSNNKPIKIKNFKCLIEDNRNLPMKEQGIIIEEYFNQWKGSTEQTDDAMVVGIKF